MNDIKVLKFGGSSLADAEHFLQVKKIVALNRWIYFLMWMKKI